jgi:arylsulfatase
LAEVLRPAGYRTYMAGKWHLGMHVRECWPLQHGFDRYFGILAGATSYFQPTGMRGLTLDNQQLPTTTNADFYTTDAFADFAIKTITEQKDDAPFFLYLAFNAPHWPLQARPEDIAKFVGKYRIGWDKLREQRHARQIQMGLLSADWALSPRDDGARAWDALSEQEQINLDYRMAVYAAQVYRLDLNVGRLVAALRAIGKLDNTLLIFLSDNGACNEPFTDLGGGEQSQINDPSVMSAVSYGTGWANLSDTPLRKFKQNLREGGIATPLIVHWPAGLKTKPGSIETNRVGYLTDMMPTFLDVSGADYPRERDGKVVTPFTGCSLLPVLLASNAPVAPRCFCWEQYGNKAVREGDWKAVYCMKGGANGTATSGRWELYNLATDRTELHDLAADRPAELGKLVARWNAWAMSSQVLPTPDPGPGGKKTPAETKPVADAPR